MVEADTSTLAAMDLVPVVEDRLALVEAVAAVLQADVPVDEEGAMRPPRPLQVNAAGATWAVVANGMAQRRALDFNVATLDRTCCMGAAATKAAA